MNDHDARTHAALAALYPGAQWDVVAGAEAPAMAVCATYGTILAAVGALRAAGFRPARHSIPAPGVDARHDRTTCLKYSAGDGFDVVLVRRR